MVECVSFCAFPADQAKWSDPFFILNNTLYLFFVNIQMIALFPQISCKNVVICQKKSLNQHFRHVLKKTFKNIVVYVWRK